MVSTWITGTLTDAIISQHAGLGGIAQQLAEVYYIVGAQQLDGYGQECFLAKDERGNEVLIGASLTGNYLRFTLLNHNRSDGFLTTMHMLGQIREN